MTGFLLLCLSIFILSNETVNIWSHLLGFLLFFSLGVSDLSSVLPASGANREDYVIYAIGLFCFQVGLTRPCESDKGDMLKGKLCCFCYILHVLVCK